MSPSTPPNRTRASAISARQSRVSVASYQRYKPDIELTFIDPKKKPKKPGAARIQLNGRNGGEYAGRSEHLTQITSRYSPGTCWRLAQHPRPDRDVLDGHGERKLGRHRQPTTSVRCSAPSSSRNGFRLNSLNLALAQEVPLNASVLVVHPAATRPDAREVDKLLRYDRAQAGNLLWLVDAEPLHGLERLAEKLDLVLPPGIVIDPAPPE